MEEIYLLSVTRDARVMLVVRLPSYQRLLSINSTNIFFFTLPQRRCQDFCVWWSLLSNIIKSTAFHMNNFFHFLWKEGRKKKTPQMKKACLPFFPQNYFKGQHYAFFSPSNISCLAFYEFVYIVFYEFMFFQNCFTAALCFFSSAALTVAFNQKDKDMARVISYSQRFWNTNGNTKGLVIRWKNTGAVGYHAVWGEPKISSYQTRIWRHREA